MSFQTCPKHRGPCLQSPSLGSLTSGVSLCSSPSLVLSPLICIKGSLGLHLGPPPAPASAAAPALASWSPRRLRLGLPGRVLSEGGRPGCPHQSVRREVFQGQEPRPGEPCVQGTGQSLPGVTHTPSTAPSVETAQVTQGLGLTQGSHGSHIQPELCTIAALQTPKLQRPTTCVHARVSFWGLNLS